MKCETFSWQSNKEPMEVSFATFYGYNPQTCMSYPCYPIWISFSFLHEWQPLPFLQMFSNFLHTLHPLHRSVCEGICSFWSHHNVIQLCCCGNHFTPEFFLVLWFNPCLDQHGSCSAHQRWYSPFCY